MTALAGRTCRQFGLAMLMLAGLFALALKYALPARAQTIPELSGRVVDAANIIPDDVEARLNQKLEALETQSQRQLVVVTLPDLQGYDIADYGYQLGRHWGLGDKQRNDGALLIVAPKERKVRIEVGYGLEPILTDGLSTIIIQQPLEISIELPDVVEIDLGDTLTTLDPVIVSSLPIESFTWEPPDQLSCADCKNPRVGPVKNQQYTLTIVDANGCSASATVLVDLDRNRNIYIPNVFSPTGDGINDKFRVFAGLGVSSINFVRLYDRWGGKLFEETNLLPDPDGTPGWDGNFRGEEMKPGVYLYLVEVEFQDGQVLLYRGDVTLLR